jgi:spermidine synthase
LLARRTFWCVARTLESAGFEVRPYHAFVPSFGEWGFCLAAAQLPTSFSPCQVPTRFVDDVTLAGFFEFPKDMSPVEVRINQIFDQQVVRYFRLDWADL